MGADGNANMAIKLFEAQIVPSLFYNCKRWIGITPTQIAELQSIQDKFMRKLMRLPPSTPKAIIHWMESMQRRIATRKLQLIRKLRLTDDSNICQQAIVHKLSPDIDGLESECMKLARKQD